jgi:hypothetical protein
LVLLYGFYDEDACILFIEDLVESRSLVADHTQVVNTFSLLEVLTVIIKQVERAERHQRDVDFNSQFTLNLDSLQDSTNHE